jgi:cell volume regulation protein A
MTLLHKYYVTFGLLVFAICLSFATQYFSLFSFFFTSPVSGFYFSVALLFTIALGLNFIAPKTATPVFVWGLLFGIALQTPFQSLFLDKNVLLHIVEVFAAFILFSAGITVPVKNFKKYFAPIAVLSFLGTLLSIFLFAIFLSVLTSLFGFTLPAFTLLLLAGILSSIDPTTILPTLEHLHFRRPFLRDIAISESAINDVVGIIVTRFFLIAALGTTATSVSMSVRVQFSTLFTRQSFDFFSVIIVWGILIGLLGAWILKTWGESVGKKHWSDPALFIAIPIFCFALGSIIPGAGFLAAFIAGLLYEVTTKAKEVHLFFESLVDRFLKPVVFILLGAMAPLSVLASPAVILIGAFSSILFMFVIRPIVVYTSLIPWMISKNALLHWREVLFLSFIRETGAIAAVLVLFTFASNLIQADLLFAIAIWVILYTLIIEPPLTPLIAKRLEVAS